METELADGRKMALRAGSSRGWCGGPSLVDEDGSEASHRRLSASTKDQSDRDTDLLEIRDLPPDAIEFATGLGLSSVVLARDDGHVVEWGDSRSALNVRSIRKSLLNPLFGSAVDRGLIDIDMSLGAIGIDDRAPGLSQREARATVRDLLMSRSGIYHPAAYEPPGMKAQRPLRGSKATGTHWFYNNWDFNVLGTIYERLTGEDVFGGFERIVADEIGMTGFVVGACKRAFDPLSDHPAHLFWMSALDLARFGLLYLRKGMHSNRQLLSRTWIEASTAYLSATGHGRLGYGYLWWVAPSEGPLGAGAHFALGAGGQGLAVIPSLKLVIVQLVDVAEGREGLGFTHFAKLIGLILRRRLGP